MKVLLLCHTFNSLSQRLHVDLRRAGHEVSVELDIHDDFTREAVSLFAPDVIVASFLKRAIPDDVWRHTLCLIVHPGVRGDRGPSALDWAILNGEATWGVTLIEAREEMDAGPVWAWREFPMRPAPKSSLYRHEVTSAAVDCVFEALERIGRGLGPLACSNQGRGQERPPCRAADRVIDPARHSAAQALRIIHASDADPGATLALAGESLRVFDAEPAPGLAGVPGTILARGGHAAAVAMREGALWIGHLRAPRPRSLKLPADRLLEETMRNLPRLAGPERCAYHEEEGVGFIDFRFYNGAMSHADCELLRETIAAAKHAGLPVLVLRSGADCWSNGIHLGIIENAESPADESWRNINAMNDLVREIIETPDRLVIAAVLGNAGAGGVFLSLAADEVWMRDGVILNPHYKDMGNLYGSEYWTYLLPARIGAARARQVTQARLPMGVAEALELGLAARRLPAGAHDAARHVKHAALELARAPDLMDRIEAKRVRRLRDEAHKPLAAYREEELERMKRNFYGFDPSYHVARYNFIHKIPKSRTPITLAPHRRVKPRVDGAWELPERAGRAALPAKR